MNPSLPGGPAPVLLIHPPTVRACEPPAGVALLAGAVRAAGFGCRIWDANLEGQLALLRGFDAADAADTWTRRAVRDRDDHLRRLRDGSAFRNPDTYRRIVGDLDRLLANGPWNASGRRLGLVDATDDRLSPTRSVDLMHAAAEPLDDPYIRALRPRLDELLGGEEPRVIGISLNYLSQALSAFAFAGLVRRLAPRARLVAGGGLVTTWMSRPGWVNPFGGLFDDLVAGPGEKRFIDIIKSAIDDSVAADAAVCGEAIAAFDLLPTADYLSPVPVLPVSASSGCYWRSCSFCPEKAEGNPFRPADREVLLRNVKNISEYMKPGILHWLDNALSPVLLRELAGRSAGTPWFGFARFEPLLAEPGMAAALRRSGCVMLQLGLESGDQGVLDALGKGIRLETAEAVLRELHRAGIGTYVYLLFGTPVEDERAARRTLDWVAARAGTIDFLNLAIFNLPLGAPEAAALDVRPFSEGDLPLYLEFAHPHGWHRGPVRRFLEAEFRRHPAIRPILHRDPPFFTSSHAPFFVPSVSTSIG
ncbi:MAG TPA: radical SAM protein [Candidatus Ozemobacteraceae bacterium]|nr:radical SAM protein [Candidatus Ozemobacteraceae bacterium]